MRSSSASAVARASRSQRCPAQRRRCRRRCARACRCTRRRGGATWRKAGTRGGRRTACAAKGERGTELPRAHIAPGCAACWSEKLASQSCWRSVEVAERRSSGSAQFARQSQGGTGPTNQSAATSVSDAAVPLATVLSHASSRGAVDPPLALCAACHPSFATARTPPVLFTPTCEHACDACCDTRLIPRSSCSILIEQPAQPSCAV